MLRHEHMSLLIKVNRTEESKLFVQSAFTKLGGRGLTNNIISFCLFFERSRTFLVFLHVNFKKRLK